ncbi:DNA excision repair protein ERCC-6-like 2 isoform X2 [Mya arenaria]|uniref:DNA excision repair protein ERCC-6-like 2 isoform X2 n=1 Tax=Mya arenaria TaxID=6604 RepID=UPI0022E0B471|nr:DNA excision repair protein ERCC-6-like 2 isoform X2 [Mya arenaria]
MSLDQSPVWAVGDACLSPYSGDGQLYRGKITKMKRSPAGGVLVTVQYTGYREEESEEVHVEDLKLPTSLRRKDERSKKMRVKGSSGGMFSPLQEGEISEQLRQRFETLDSDDEDSQVSVKAERLSALVYSEKQSTPGKSGRSVNKNRGAEITSDTFTGKTNLRNKKGHQMKSELQSPSTCRRKPALEVQGGQAKHPEQELLSSRKVSDISSILDQQAAQKALSPDRGCASRHKSGDHAQYRGGADNDWNSEEELNGFGDHDLEKPRFSFQPEGARVPLTLSEEGESPVVQVCETMNQYLRDYQREGIQFLYEHYRQGQGAILGDDMGLGKTIQVIGFLSALLGKKGNRIDIMRQKPGFIRQLSDTASVREDPPCKGPFLIIGPGCVLYNWLEELGTWGYFSVRKYHGADKAECLKDLRRGKVEIVVTTFETFRDHQESLNAVDWKAVIVDEVHKIKDLKAQATQALRKVTTPCRFGLTGTALQNNLTEFYSILDWARPGCLGRLTDFERDFVKPMELGQRHDANKRELALARKRKEKLAEVRKGMMIRRMKTLIADQLPKKDDRVVFCRLSGLQTSIYQTILSQPHMELVLHKDDPCGCDSGQPQSKCCKQKTGDGYSIQSLMFTFMHLLLKTSNHVALLIPRERTSEQQARLARTICKAALKDHPEFVSQTKEASFKTLSDPKYCGKMKVLQGLLKVFNKEKSKVLVFSYSTQVLDIIEQYMMTTGYEYRRIDGSVSCKKRMVVVREFNKDPNIFICLISTKAGGLGLNLTGANRVLIFDPNWNPTHDLQAQDRAYRLGQQRDVQVFRLVSTGTIEENMYLRQIYKQQLLNVTVEDGNARRYFYAVQGSRHQKGELFGVKNMFSLRTGDACFTHDILKRTERVENALVGFDTVRYTPPVPRLDEDEEYNDVITDNGLHSDDVLQQFFSTEDSDSGIDNVEIMDEVEDRERESCKQPRKKKLLKPRSRKRIDIDDSESDSSEPAADSVDGYVQPGKVKLKFREPEGGKVKPSESRTGKGPMRKETKTRTKSDKKEFEVDQTLVGTLANVSDVFDNCGVVHVHENVRVVGGSRAEDHMSRCAISDVYELHQNSQDLAVQCELLPQSSDKEEKPAPLGRGRKRSEPEVGHNTSGSKVIGRAKVIIGQTPRAIRLKQMEAMCKFHTAGSLLDFACLVLGSSVQERVQLLSRYYLDQEPELQQVLDDWRHDNTVNQEKTEKKMKNVVKKKAARREPVQRRPAKRKAVQSICFLDDVEMESESPSLVQDIDGNVDSDMEGDDVGDADMEVGRKVTPRKRLRTVTVKQKTRAGRGKHVPEMPSYLVDNNGESQVKASQVFKKRRPRKLIKQESSEESDLLTELEKQQVDMEHKNRSDDYHETAKLNKNRDISSKPNSSFLDDLFSSFETTSPKHKPPPKSKVKSPVKKKSDIVCGDDDDDCKPDGIFDPFKEIDEIFTDSAKSQTEEEVHLDRSTLKDDNMDCLDDPRLWKRRKVVPSHRRRNLVDRLIADSEAEYKELFADGKLKKKQGAENSLKSRSTFDGSQSLFS